MSIISDYWRYFANVDTTKDFKSVIDEIYNWFFRKLWERGMAYTEKSFADAPISVSDFPGQEWGFRPIDVEMTGDSIVGARSGGIPVGSKVENAALSVDLPAGTYDCVAYFNNADPETGAILGTAGAEITITVEN